ncbi:lactonase family protein [Jatrophihabitans telluris]|uniref:Lactonase family protein n=1 Tax=Jatrophihabitans telluris TaxID=2038343 RepID=A0ABY4QYG7_9ACTN|nr:beta-propeller fold lactonase family protein [Jatrophihabitans telluris]UQX88469.1 lactonase family protein [Jatrophihabitans telluris]
MSAFEPTDPLRLLIGCYTPPRGTGVGMLLLTHDHAAATLTVTGLAGAAVSPSALAVSLDGEVVFAVEEGDPGVLHSFRLDAYGPASSVSLVPVSSRPSGGADPCHLLLDPSGEFLFTANYSGSTIAVHPVSPSGELGPATDVRRFTGSGPLAARQQSSHPHMIALRPGHSELAVADLGADVVRRVPFDPSTGRFGPDLAAVSLPSGSGPRQIVFAPDGSTAYVLGELDSSLAVIDWSAQRPEVSQHVPCLADANSSGNLAATLVLEGSRLFASQRGADEITLFAVDGTASIDASCAHRVERIGAVPAHGQWPRHIAVVADWLYIANEVSGTVVAVRLHETGSAGDVLTVQAPSATFVLPLGTDG